MNRRRVGGFRRLYDGSALDHRRRGWWGCRYSLLFCGGIFVCCKIDDLWVLGFVLVFFCPKREESVICDKSDNSVLENENENKIVDQGGKRRVTLQDTQTTR